MDANTAIGLVGIGVCFGLGLGWFAWGRTPWPTLPASVFRPGGNVNPRPTYARPPAPPSPPPAPCRCCACTHGVPAAPASQPVGWMDSFGELHKRREDAWDGDPDSTPPRPVYEAAAGVTVPAGETLSRETPRSGGEGQC